MANKKSMPNIVKKGRASIQLTLEEKIYPLSTIYAAGYVFLDRAYIYLDKDHRGKIIVCLFAKSKKEDLDILGKDFCNELLNYAHYFDSLKVNAEVVKILMQRALFSAAPSLADEAEQREVEEVIKSLEEEK